MASKIWISTASGDWNVAANWSSTAVPVSGDDVYFENNAIAVTTNLNQSAVTLNSLNVAQSYTGTIGSSSAYLQIGATTCNIGLGASSTATGSTRIKIDFGTVATTVFVYNTSQSSADANLEPVRFIGTDTGNALYVLGGTVGIGTTSSAEVPHFATVECGTGAGGQAALRIGAGAVLNAVAVANGTVTNLGAAVTTLTTSGNAKYTCYGTAAYTTINHDGGTIYYSGSGNIATLNSSATMDCSGNAAPKTIAQYNPLPGAQLIGNASFLTITATTNTGAFVITNS